MCDKTLSKLEVQIKFGHKSAPAISYFVQRVIERRQKNKWQNKLQNPLTMKMPQMSKINMQEEGHRDFEGHSYLMHDEIFSVCASINMKIKYQTEKFICNPILMKF